MAESYSENKQTVVYPIVIECILLIIMRYIIR